MVWPRVLLTFLLYSDRGVMVIIFILCYNPITGSASNYHLQKGTHRRSWLLQVQPIPVSCSSANISSVESIEWFVNGRKECEDKSFSSDPDVVISNYVM